MARITKARYWTGVLYPENMRTDWQESIGDIVQVPYAYCCHTHDMDSKSEYRKDHVHVILVFPNTTTYKHAMSVFDLLSADNKRALNTIEAIVNIRSMYDYLIHDTETCRKKGKELYPASARITGNNFDIGAYEQLGVAEKHDMLKELVGFIISEKFTNITDFTVAALDTYGHQYWEVIVAYNRMLDSYCAGNYKKEKRKRELVAAVANVAEEQ